MMTVLNTSLVGNLILARLLTAGKRPLSPAKLREDLSRLFPHPPIGEQWQGHLEELTQAGMITMKPLRLTESGRSEALAFLGLEALPPRTDWRALQRGYLVAKALGLDSEAKTLREKIQDEEGLAAYLLRSRYDVPLSGTATLKKVLEALACKQICIAVGIPPETTLVATRNGVLSRLINSPERLTWEKLQKEVPGHTTGTRLSGRNSLHEAVLKGWLERSTNSNPQERISIEESAREDFDLATFAVTVRAGALRCPSGRFGDNKVFISHVWSCLREETPFRHFDLESFKENLLKAHLAGLLQLERADLVQAMEPADVRESEIAYLNATFHFVLVERDRP